MYIKELYIGAFGGLRERTFSFAEGINLIEGGNESGKSTLCAFIKFIFFGLPAKSRVVMSDRKRYLPFDGSAAGGTLTLVQGDEEYIISRTFTPSGRGGSDRVEIRSLTTGEAVSADPAEHFLGMTEGLFTRTAYIPQLSGGLVDGNEVSAAMENLLYSKDEEIDSAAAIKALEKAATSLVHKRGSGGKLNEATAELDLLTAKAAVSSGVKERLGQLEEQISSLSAAEKENARHLSEAEENIAKYRASEILRDFDILEKSEKALAEEKAQYAALLPGGNVPASEDLMEMVRLSEGIKNAEKELADYEASPLPDLPVSVLASDGGKDRVKESLGAKSAKSRGMTACGIILFVAALVLAALPIFAHLTSLIFIGAAVCAVAGAVLLAIGLTAGKEVKNKFKKYGVSSLGELDSLAHREENDRLMYEKEMSERREGLLLLKNRQQDQIMAASALLAGYGAGYKSADALAGEVARLSALREKLVSMKMNMDAAQKEQAKAREALSEHDREGLKASLSGDPYEILATVDIKENERRASFGKLSKDNFREKLSELQLKRVGLAREAEEAEAVGERISALNEEIAAMRSRYTAVTVALSALESAAADVKEQFSPSLAARAAEIMAQATGGKYDRLLLGREMNISYMDNENGGTVRDADHLSAGTKDMAYISLRLALCEVLCEKGGLPMIFDESFAAMDDVRLAAILGVIAKREGQSLILTSGVREGAFLAGNAHCISLAQ